MERLTVLTLNIFGEQPPLEQRMKLMIRGLIDLSPDVVALQEVREIAGQLPNQATTLADACGYARSWTPATPWGGGTEGLAILSRYPIVKQESAILPASTPDETRRILMAAVETPAGTVHCYTTHLHYRLTH